MQVDLLHGLRYQPPPSSRRLSERGGLETELAAPNILTFDSGLGGLTVNRWIALTRPDADILYVADDAAFPYGRLTEPTLTARVEAVMERLIALHAPDVVVIACNTASTLVLPPLRARWPHIAFVGTVPAVKPAAEASRSGLVSVLATPGTVSRDYTRKLVDDYAAGVEVTLVGSQRLATLAEAAMRGAPVDETAIRTEIAPCFVERDGRRTDVVALGCTHYPLLLDAFERLAPWPVRWIDPAPAIARRVADVLAAAGVHASRGENRGRTRIAFTSGRAAKAELRRWLQAQDVSDAPEGLAAAPFAR
jgi:glutamate racemase